MAVEERRAYQPGYVAGHHSLRYDTEPQSALEQAKGRMAKVIEGDCRDDIGGDEQRVHSVDTYYSDVTFKLMLLPVWIGCYLFGGKAYQVLINGINGEVQGDRPYSTVKIMLVVLAVLTVVTGAVWIYAVNHG
ncbi:hypothetical protein ACGFNP_57500 [Nonomuraea sp. NPDC049269]|uniref:hypothetical protein n=1 Tax=Nonomuraea sp. NPDC049269 TaxID=3364349 RepID=UPI00371306B5